MVIKIIKEKKATDYTFIDDDLVMKKPAENKEPGASKNEERGFRLREDFKTNRLRKSKITGGHGMQGHSPVYE
jgi:hypothetical protein